VLAGVYVPNLDLPGNWTYAVQAALPIGWVKADADVGRSETVQEGDRNRRHRDHANLAWLAQRSLQQVLLRIIDRTAPNGAWENGDIASIGLNYWTFTPAIAFTYLVPEHGLDLSASLGVDINTKNTDTDY
jgi:hypothetical protein